jgi:hypothetical protein
MTEPYGRSLSSQRDNQSPSCIHFVDVPVWRSTQSVIADKGLGGHWQLGWTFLLDAVLCTLIRLKELQTFVDE